MSALPGVFIDTSGWIALLEDPDAHRWVDATARAETGLGKAHTSDYVVLEAYSFIVRNHRRTAALRFLDIATGPGFILHPSDGDLVDRAIQRARERALKRELTLVDWTTALLMGEHRLRHIVTTDRGFAQLGFELLP